MTRPENIGWGKYKSYEGAYFIGTQPYRLPANPSENHKILAVITATEGGRADAINAYDRCIISVGLIQYCEASYYLTSNLLGSIAERDPQLLKPMEPALAASNAEFKRNAKGRWRFFFKDKRGEVDTGDEQKQLFLLNSNGLKGSWDTESTAHVKLWAASLANVLAQPEAQEVQVDYTAARIKVFAVTNAKKLLLDDPAPSTGWVGAMRAAYLSFAANLPAVAGKHLEIALQSAPGPKWSEDWCLHILKELTFGPKISIYPHRYDKIRPVLERLYGVDLPDFSHELKQHESEFEAICPAGSSPKFDTAESIQEFLIDLGYDLGPTGADGKIGPKTLDAIQTFQSTNGLQPDGIVGPRTRAKMLEVFRERC